MKQAEFHFVVLAETPMEAQTGCPDSCFHGISHAGYDQIEALASWLAERGSFTFCSIGIDEGSWESEFDRICRVSRSTSAFLNPHIRFPSGYAPWAKDPSLYRAHFEAFLAGRPPSFTNAPRPLYEEQLHRTLGECITGTENWWYRERVMKEAASRIIMTYELSLALLAAKHFQLPDGYILEHKIRSGSWFRALIEVNKGEDHEVGPWRILEMETPAFVPRFRANT